MLQNLLPLLPRRIGTVGLTVAAISSLAGGGFWLLGARFSRPLLALAASIGGGAIGFNSPHWFGWSIDPWAVAVFGSLLLGIAGFLCHAYLAAAGLGIVLAVWGVLAGVSYFGLPDHLNLLAMPQNLPTHQAAMLLYTAGISAVVGTGIGLIWRRLGTVLFWSLLGISIFLTAALSAAQSAPKFIGPRYPRMVPAQPGAQSLLLAGLVAVGAAVQWRIAFVRRPAKKTAGNSKAG